MALHGAGRDEFGKQVCIGFVSALSEIRDVVLPEGDFMLLLAGPTHDLSVDAIYSAAELLLDRGAVYVMCWGEGARRCEDIIDEAVAMKSLDHPVALGILTTAHENESLSAVLEFATATATPADAYVETCRNVVLLFHTYVGWYNEAQSVLEKLLSNGAA